MCGVTQKETVCSVTSQGDWKATHTALTPVSLPQKLLQICLRCQESNPTTSRYSVCQIWFEKQIWFTCSLNITWNSNVYLQPWFKITNKLTFNLKHHHSKWRRSTSALSSAYRVPLFKCSRIKNSSKTSIYPVAKSKSVSC